MNDPRSIFDRLIAICLGLLVGAAAVYIAVRLIEAVWTALLVILGVACFIAIAIAALRNHRDRW